MHGPLEFLFTIDEETGLTGAGGLDPALLAAQRLINLDSEEEGSPHGGVRRRSRYRPELTLASTPPAPTRPRRGDASASMAATRVSTSTCSEETRCSSWRGCSTPSPGTRPFLWQIEGGNKHNAIPREAGHGGVPEGESGDFLRTRGAVRGGEGRVHRPRAGHEAERRQAPMPPRSGRPTRPAVLPSGGTPHGVVVMSNDIAGLVETSTNLAVAERRRA